MTVVFNILALLAAAATSVMNWAGSEYSLYLTQPWWDIPTHFLGGLTIALCLATVATHFGLSVRRAAWLILGVAFTIGVGWEVWELWLGIGGGWGGYWFDTIKDLCVDTGGAFLALALYAHLVRSRD